MLSNMGSVTRLAYSAITDEQLLMERYSTPEAVLDYLQNESNFKTLSAIIKETMIKAGICSENDTQARFVSELYSRLAKQDVECETEKRSDAAIKRWISGYTKTIRHRKTAIEICFALNLDLELSNSFLNKCGYNSFNVRDAQDATYLYCIINGRPLSVATAIMSKYLTCAGEEPAAKEALSKNHSGSTTVILENTLGNSSWESDDDFLRTYLIPNKSRFIGYATTAVNEYYMWKNNLWFVVISDAISNELTSIKLLANTSESVPDSINDFFPTLQAVQSALNKHSDDKSLLYNAYKTFNGNPYNIESTMGQIKAIMGAATDLNSRVQIAEFLSDILKAEGLLKRTVMCLLSNEGRLRKRSESSLAKNVMDEFPYDDAFAQYEHDPSSMKESASIRKAIVLMYYIAYAYEFSMYFADEKYGSDLFGELGFVEFFDGLNKTLLHCHLPQIYPANQFDWLVLRSIREFEISDYAGEEGDPIAFFNDVLAFSFNDESPKPSITD